jgi:hypothetical protein
VPNLVLTPESRESWKEVKANPSVRPLVAQVLFDIEVNPSTVGMVLALETPDLRTKYVPWGLERQIVIEWNQRQNPVQIRLKVEALEHGRLEPPGRIAG